MDWIFLVAEQESMLEDEHEVETKKWFTFLCEEIPMDCWKPWGKKEVSRLSVLASGLVRVSIVYVHTHNAYGWRSGKKRSEEDGDS